MLIAILNGFPFHYEMFGCVIEYCLERKIDFDIYTNLHEAHHWFQWYNQLFQKNFTIQHHLSFTNDKKYDHVFFLTDDDFRIPTAIVDHRYLCYDHHINMRRPEITRHLSVRPFNRTKNNWALPVYSYLTKTEKEQTRTGLSILFVGRCNMIKSRLDIEKLQKLFINFNNIKFIFINRCLFLHPHMVHQAYPNMSFFENINTPEMMKLIHQASHVFITDDYKDHTTDKDHITDSMSASLPMGIGSLCQLIMPTIMYQHYKFPTAITYDPTSKLILQLPSLDDLENERRKLLNHRNNVYDRFFSISSSSSSSSEQLPLL